MSDIGALNLEFNLGIGNAIDKLDSVVSKLANIESSISQLSNSGSLIPDVGGAIDDLSKTEVAAFKLAGAQGDLIKQSLEISKMMPSMLSDDLILKMFRFTESYENLNDELTDFLKTGDDISKLRQDEQEILVDLAKLYHNLSAEQKKLVLQHPVMGAQIKNLNQSYIELKRRTDDSTGAAGDFAVGLAGASTNSEGLIGNIIKLGNESTKTAGALGLISTTLLSLKADEDDYSKRNLRAIGDVKALQQAHMDLQIQYGATNEEAKKTIISLAEAGINSEKHGKILDQLIDSNFQLQMAYDVSSESVAKYQYITAQFDATGEKTTQTLTKLANASTDAGLSGTILSGVLDKTAQNAQTVAKRFENQSDAVFVYTNMITNALAASRDLEVNAQDMSGALTTLWENPKQNARFFINTINDSNASVEDMVSDMAAQFEFLRSKIPTGEDGLVISPELLSQVTQLPLEQAAAMDKFFIQAGGSAEKFEKSLMQAYGESISLAEENEQTLASLGRILNRIWGSVGGTLKRLFEPLTKLLGAVLVVVADLLEIIADAIAVMDGWGITGDILKSVLAVGLVGALLAVKGGMLGVLSIIPKMVGGLIGMLGKVTGLNKAFGGLANKMKGFNKAASAAPKTPPAGGGIGGFLKSLANGVSYFGKTVTPKHLGIIALAGTLLLGLGLGLVLLGGMMADMGVTAGQLIGLAVALGIMAAALIGVMVALSIAGGVSAAAAPVIAIAIVVILALGAALWIVAKAFEVFAGALETLLPVISQNMEAFWALIGWMTAFTLIVAPFALAAGAFIIALGAMILGLVAAWVAFPNEGMKEMNARFLDLVNAASMISAGALNNVLTMGKNMKIIASDLEDAEDDFPTSGIDKMASALAKFHTGINKFTLGDALILRNVTSSLVKLGGIGDFNAVNSLEGAAPKLKEFSNAAKESHDSLAALSRVIKEINQGFSQLDTDISVSTEMIKKITAESSTITSVKFTGSGLEVKNDPSKKNAEETLTELKKLNKTMDDIREKSGDSGSKMVVDAINRSGSKVVEAIEESSDKSGSNTGWD